MFFALCTDKVRVVGDPVALDHRRVALRRRRRGAARGRRLRGARADRDHRARARSDARRDLARAARQRAPTRPARLRRCRRHVPRRRPRRARALRAAPLLEPTDGDAGMRRRGRPRRRHRPLPLGHAEQPRDEVVARRAHRSSTGVEVTAGDRPPARAHGRTAAEGEGDGRGEQGVARPRRPATEHTAAPEHVPLVEEPIGEGLSAPPSPGKSMVQTFLREPARIAHLTRMLLGLLARDPITLPRVTAQDIGGAFGVQGAPDARGRRGAARGRRPRAVGEVDRGPQRAPARRRPGARGDARRRGRAPRRRHAARRCAWT